MYKYSKEHFVIYDIADDSLRQVETMWNGMYSQSISCQVRYVSFRVTIWVCSLAWHFLTCQKNYHDSRNTSMKLI